MVKNVSNESTVSLFKGGIIMVSYVDLKRVISRSTQFLLIGTYIFIVELTYIFYCRKNCILCEKIMKFYKMNLFLLHLFLKLLRKL